MAYPSAPVADAMRADDEAVAKDEVNHDSPRLSVDPAPTKVGVDNVVSVEGHTTSYAYNGLADPIVDTVGGDAEPWVLTNV